MMARSPHAGQSGFTLVEIMMVLAMLGLISAMGVWGMLPTLEHEKVRRAASVLIGDVQYAQALAARQRKPVAIVFNESLRMYMVKERGGTTVYRERFLGDDTDYDIEAMVITPEPSVEVFPNGLLTRSLTVTIGIKDYEQDIVMSRAGQVRARRHVGGG